MGKTEQMFLKIQPVILGTISKILVPFMTPSLAFSTVTLNNLENIKGRQELRQAHSQQELKLDKHLANSVNDEDPKSIVVINNGLLLLLMVK